METWWAETFCVRVSLTSTYRIREPAVGDEGSLLLHAHHFAHVLKAGVVGYQIIEWGLVVLHDPCSQSTPSKKINFGHKWKMWFLAVFFYFGVGVVLGVGGGARSNPSYKPNMYIMYIMPQKERNPHLSSLLHTPPFGLLVLQWGVYVEYSLMSFPRLPHDYELFSIDVFRICSNKKYNSSIKSDINWFGVLFF